MKYFTDNDCITVYLKDTNDPFVLASYHSKVTYDVDFIDGSPNIVRISIHNSLIRVVSWTSYVRNLRSYGFIISDEIVDVVDKYFELLHIL